MDKLRVGVVGCAGRMGRMVARCLTETEACVLAGGTEAAGSAALGRDLGELAGLGIRDLPVDDDPVGLFARADAVIDFTTPEATRIHAGLAAQAMAVHVIGTTGLDAGQEDTLERAPPSSRPVQLANVLLLRRDKLPDVLDMEFWCAHDCARGGPRAMPTPAPSLHSRGDASGCVVPTSGATKSS